MEPLDMNSDNDLEAAAEREQFIALIRERLAEAEVGQVIDDAEVGPDLNAALDRLFGPLDDRMTQGR